MGHEGEGVHRVLLRTLEGDSLAGKDEREALEQALRALSARYPGLRVAGCRVLSEGVELTLDLGRLDEDLQRIAQSFKNEVKKLAPPRQDGAFWRWGFEEL
jgi:hypothetical protein